MMLAILFLLPVLADQIPDDYSTVAMERRVRRDVKRYFPQEPVESFRFEIFPDDTRIVEVEPGARAEDYARAFDVLRNADPAASIYAVVKGISIDHIVDVENMGASGLLVLVTQHNNRERRHVVKAEEVEMFGQRQATQLAPNVTFPENW